jgi:putative membrane protein
MSKMMVAAAVALLASVFGTRAEDKPTPAPFDAAAFAKAVAIGGMYDVYLSELVGSQTKNIDVRKLAVGLVADHLVAGPGLKAAAKQAGIELPKKLDDAHQKQYNAFKTYKGDDLDRDFVKAVVQRLTVGVALFTRASKEAKNKDIKDFATKNLPTLQNHLEMAKRLEK